MSRTAVALLAVLFLAGGVGVGVLVGGIARLPSPAPSAAAAQASPAPASQASGTPSPSPPATPSPLPATPTPSPAPVLVADPLDGVPVAPEVAARRVVAVMIDDQQDARPQSGLSAASVVWQAPAEGGIPRYMALFSEGDPPLVGPIRSSRLYFIAWAAEWNAVYAHVGGSPQAMALLRSAQGRGSVVWNADEFRFGPSYMWRIKTRLAPHNVYTDAGHLRSLVKAAGASASVAYTPAWQFGPDIDPGQRPVGGSIVVPYLANRISYQYDPASNSYLRSVSVEGEQVDAGTKERIAPKNVVVVYMSFAPLQDGTQKHRLEAKFTGSGKALVFTGGGLVKATWRKASMTAPTYLYGPDGRPVTLTAGQTLVQVVPLGTAVSYKLGAAPVASSAPGSSGSPGPPSPSPSPIGLGAGRGLL